MRGASVHHAQISCKLTGDRSDHCPAISLVPIAYQPAQLITPRVIGIVNARDPQISPLFAINRSLSLTVHPSFIHESGIYIVYYDCANEDIFSDGCRTPVRRYLRARAPV